MERLRLLQASSTSRTFLGAAATAKGEEGRWEVSGFIAIEIVDEKNVLNPTTHLPCHPRGAWITNSL
jgi:hypothetical protein